MVTKGIATIDHKGKKIILKRGQSLFVKQAEIHRISNMTKSILEIVEVQIGSVLKESDIVRIDDVYGRGRK